MSEIVVKRDGREVKFNCEKILNAIIKAMKQTEKGIDEELAHKIADSISKIDKKKLGVEEIQDLIENKLMASSRKDVAKEFILYRQKRTEIRERGSQLMKLYDSIVLQHNKDILNENANVDGESPMGIMGKIGYESARVYALQRLVKPHIRDAIKNNYIYPHDFDFYSTGTTTCLTRNNYITLKDADGNVINTKINYFDSEMVNNRVDPKGFHILGRNGWTKLNNIVRRRLRDDEKVFEIRTRKGLPLEVTEDHKIPVIRDDTEVLLQAKELVVGDILLRPSYTYSSENEVLDLVELFKDIPNIVIVNIRKLKQYLNYKYDINNLASYLNSDTSKYGNHYIYLRDYVELRKQFNIPDEVEMSLQLRELHGGKSLPLYLPITPELARLLGYLLSDGSVYINEKHKTYHFTITNTNPDINEDIQYVIESVFNDTPSIRIDDGREYGRVLCGKIYYLLFSEVLKVKTDAFNISIPDFILNASNEIKTNFIKAVFDGDGTITQNEIKYSTVCKQFAEQLVILLKSLDINSHIYERNTEGEIGNYNGVQFKRNGNTYIVSILTKNDMFKFQKAIGKLLKQQIDYDYGFTLNSKRYISDQIKNIKELEYNEYVYDIETAEHWFVANGFIVHNCCQIPLGKMLKKGFNTGHGYIRQPSNILSATALAAIILQANQNMQHGGQAFAMFDYDLEPYVKKTYEKYKKFFEELFINKEDVEKLAWEKTEKDTFQAMEAFVHNMNSMNSRSAGQVPFTSINYGTNTSKEGRLIIKSILLATEAGLGAGETPIFPIQIFKIKEGINFNPEDPNYDLFKLACRVTSKRLFPNFSFMDATYNAQYYDGTPETEVPYMGCRTRVIGNVCGKEQAIGRGNLSFTTINLVKIAIEANRNIDDFFKSLDHYIDLVIEQLLDRFEYQGKKLAKNFKFLMQEGVWIDSDKLKPNDTLKEVLKQGTLSMGFIGLAEALKALIGKHHGESEIARELGYLIVKHMRERMDEATEKYNLNFTLLATPAEGLSGKFVIKDKNEFGIIEGVTDRKYYTNSFHVPVYYQTTIKDKIKIEAPFHEWCNAGHITYVEIDGNARNNPEAIMQIVKYMKESNIGYGSINHPVDRCMNCEYEGIIGNECPKCHVKESEGAKIARIRRITGYLVGTLDRFNSAKKAEVEDRVKHN